MGLIFQKKKKSRRPVNRPTMASANYSDTCQILDIIRQTYKLPDNYVEPIRIKLVRNKPFPAYRVTLFARSDTERFVKQCDGRTVKVFAGQYVAKSWFVTKTNQEDFSFNPPLET